MISEQVLAWARAATGGPRRPAPWVRALAPVVPSLAIAAVSLLAIPSPFVLGLGVSIGIWVILGVSYSITFGLAGQFSVAHAAVFGTGAYATAILMTRWGVSFWWTLPAATVAGALVGGLIGLPSWRLGGDYVALITLAAGVMFQEVALNWTPVTGGPQGIANIPNAAIGDHAFADADYFVMSVAMALTIVLVAIRLGRSNVGRTWLAIREDELAAQAVGIRTGRSKVLAFAAGGALAAVAGSIYAVYQTFVSSVSFGVVQSVQVILIVLLGGLGRMWGAAVAAALLTILTAELATVTTISLGLDGGLVLVAIMIRRGVFTARLAMVARRSTARSDVGHRRDGRSARPAGGDDAFSPARIASWKPDVDRRLLDVVALTRTYGGVRAVDAVSFTLAPGQILAVIGQNGSGKTTLVNVITGVHPPTSGRVSFGGRDITGWSLSAIARLGVARTFQNLRLFEALSVRDNVLLGAVGRVPARLTAALLPTAAAARRNRHIGYVTDRTLEELGIHHLAHAVVNGLAHGDRRRVEIARALVSDPALLILDEPTAGLTAVEAEGLVEALERLRTESRGALVIEHNLAAVGRIADDVLVLHEGRQIGRGPVAVTLADPRVRSLYLGIES